MLRFLRKIFPKEPPPFDLKQEVSIYIQSLPPCAPYVIIASPKYSGNYRCEILINAQRLADFVEDLNNATSGGSISSQIGRSAFSIWLHDAVKTGTATSYIPPLFVSVISSYVANFIKDGTASVFCPDCQKIVDSVDHNIRNREQKGPWSEWTEGWQCPSGHLLYTEDQEVHILRRNT